MSVAQQALEHDVLFAESDDELVGLAGDRLAAALAAGAATVVIATPVHHRLFADRIRAAGQDPEDARADGSLVTLDAAATLDSLCPGGRFAGDAFEEVVGALVRDRAARGPVFAFGEMVALLFDSDRVQEAIELETAWDELLLATSAGLLCAYPVTLLDEPAVAAGVAAVCGMHAAVVTGGPFRRSWRLRGDRAAASEARRLVAGALRARAVPEDTFYDTLSVVTELVANAVTHGSAPHTLEVDIDGPRVVVRVGDGSERVPVVRPAAGRRPVQRGLHLVDEIARRWGYAPLAAGKIVWAELAR